MKKRIIIFFLIIVSGLCFARSGLRFIEEDLSFGIEDSIFSVQGIYYFSTDSPGKYPILYPFPEDDIHGDPFDIRIMDMQKGEEIKYKTVKKSRSIRFAVKADEDTPVLISYKQRLYSNTARYILMSTHSWQESLGRVEYKLKISENFKITYFSIEPDNEVSLDFGRLYLWQRENFMPDRDLIFEFEEK